MFISENQAITLETPNVSVILKNHKHKYKSEWYKKSILRIGQVESSTKFYNVCRYNKNITHADLKWQCNACGELHK